ncbi:dienelactone hydrolase family protein [Anianabacter salinae]|uniref:dienelactone hydrolase family protein n=1 Tax=Anianabacter salinae TaxID=2851023 RepID=UPI00225E39E6|nr:hypothetical protein [Anianabacter salinae]MBV0911793.1 hypothetical protein [Anianabacter salinae]
MADSAALRRHFEIGDHPLAFVTEADGRVRFETLGGEAVDGFLILPDGPGPHPVVLVIHAHGNRHDIGARELVEGRPAAPEPIGPVLRARGIASLCLDLPCFGGRSSAVENAAAKAALWQGRSLAGQMMGELSSQIDWLAADPRFGPIGVYGLSMGATLGYWLAAVEPRIAALAHLCCLADLDALIATGAHDLHGPYLTIPGLPRTARNGQIAGMIAPRPQLGCFGALDPLTPPGALSIALDDLRAGYAAVPDALEILIDRGVGHVETPQMRARVLSFFSRTLG